MQFEAVLDLQTDPEGTQAHSASAARVDSQQQPGHQQSVSNQPIQDQVCLLLAALPQHRARVGIEQAASRCPGHAPDASCMKLYCGMIV